MGGRNFVGRLFDIGFRTPLFLVCTLGPSVGHGMRDHNLQSGMKSASATSSDASPRSPRGRRIYNICIC